MRRDTLEDEARLLEHKKASASWSVWVYLTARSYFVDPLILINDRSRMREVKDLVRDGQIDVQSSLEIAMLADVREELRTGVETSENLLRESSTKMMAQRYLKLVQ